MGTKTSGARGPRNPELVAEIRWLYEGEGLSLQAIADRLGITQKMANKLAKKWGVQLRRPGARGGTEHPNWKGRTVDKSGYILVYLPDHPHANLKGYVREHRIVAEQMLGRFLERTEVVHHKNDDPSDNRPENLQVFRTNGEHLAETLAGKCPNWSTEGKQRIAAGIAERFQADATQVLDRLEQGVLRRQETIGRSIDAPAGSSRSLFDTVDSQEPPRLPQSPDSCSGHETAQ